MNKETTTDNWLGLTKETVPPVRNIEVTRSSSCYGGSSYRIFDKDTDETIYRVEKTASWQDQPKTLIGYGERTLSVEDLNFEKANSEVIETVCGTSELIDDGHYWRGRYAGCRKFKQLNSNFNQEERLTVKGRVKLATYLAQFATKTWADHQAEKKVADVQSRHDNKVWKLERQIQKTQQILENQQAELASLNG